MYFTSMKYEFCLINTVVYEIDIYICMGKYCLSLQYK